MKKLSLNKEVISKLNNDEMGNIKGGIIDMIEYENNFFTTGCTDGCTTHGTWQTAWRCTKGNCSGDCGTTPKTTL